MTSREKLSAHQRKAVETTEGARVLVGSMNREMSYKDEQIRTLQANLADIQDKYDGVRSQNHELDVNNALLSSRLETFIGMEILKFVLSGVGVAIGINLLTDGKVAYGLLVTVASVLLYSFLAWLQRTATKRKSPDSHAPSQQ